MNNYECVNNYEDLTLIDIISLYFFLKALVLLVFTATFSLLLINMYVEFGWKVYKFVNCNPALRCKLILRIEVYGQFNVVAI